MCSGVYFENDVLVFPNGYAVRNKLRQNLVDKPDKTNIHDSDLLDNVKRTDFYENIDLWCLV